MLIMNHLLLIKFKVTFMEACEPRLSVSVFRYNFKEIQNSNHALSYKHILIWQSNKQQSLQLPYPLPGYQYHRLLPLLRNWWHVWHHNFDKFLYKWIKSFFSNSKTKITKGCFQQAKLLMFYGILWDVRALRTPNCKLSLNFRHHWIHLCNLHLEN